MPQIRNEKLSDRAREILVPERIQIQEKDGLTVLDL